MIADLRHALRALWRQPAFSAIAVLTLALGIGANTALFSVADAVLLRPLPYPEPERLVWIEGAPLRSGKTSFVGLARELHESPLFEDGGLFAPGALNVGAEGSAERVRAATVTHGFFTALAAPPVSGRLFTEQDIVGQERVALVSESLARRRGLEPGGALPLNGRVFTVIGIMPPRVDFPNRADIWIPMGTDRQITGRALAPRTLARLAPGVTPAQAVAEIDRIEAERYGRPRDPRERAPTVVPLTDFLVGPVRPLFMVLSGGVLLVLLVACINTANLLLARVTARQREMSVRRALGASRWRLTRHLLAESALLAAAAGVAALPIALWTLDAVTMLLPPTLHTSGPIAIDVRAILATGALCVGAMLLFGLAPAWSLRGTTEGTLLRGTTTATADPFWRRFRSGLVAAEIAIALVLIAGAATIVKTVGRLMQTDIGVAGERVLTAETTLPIATYDTGERIVAFHARLESALEGLPGVEAVGATSMLPGSNEVGIGTRLIVEGLDTPSDAAPVAGRLSATPGYFRAIGLALVAGRGFTPEDRLDAPRVAIVSEQAASMLGLEPEALVGRRLQIGFGQNAQWATIVGVARNVLIRGPEQRPVAQIFEPMAQVPGSGTTYLAVKTHTPPAAFAPALRAAVASVDPDLPLYNVRTFDEIRAAFIADRRFAMAVMSAFGLLATLLAAIGLYGVLTYLVQLRTREIGIRMALGATPGAVRRQVVRSGALHAIAGLLVGIAGAYASSQLLVSRIAGVEPAGPALLAAVAAAMFVAAVAVTWLPARRATSISPLLALRSDE